MSGATRVRAINVTDSEARPVLGLAGNKLQRPIVARKPASKPLKMAEKSAEEVGFTEDKNGISSPDNVGKKSSPSLHSLNVPSILRQDESLLRSNLSLSASCSSDASTDSVRSRASTGRLYRTSSTSSRKKQLASKAKFVVQNGAPEALSDGLEGKRRCAWVTANSDLLYVAFHDEEWGVPVHDDKKLFELLVLCGALSELTWPTILSKRNIFREVFADFDPIAVAKLNERKLTSPGSPSSLLLSELKLRAVIENARQVSKVIEEFGSFDKYIWSFVNYKPLVSKFRYPRQVPVKTPKADVMSKDLVRRGFRSVGPTVVYSFMQVAGITNDHLISCFRFHDCVVAEVEGAMKDIAQEERANTETCCSIDELIFSSE